MVAREISFVLLVGAALMVRTFTTLLAVDPGFDPRHTVVGHLALPDSKYPEEQDLWTFYRRVLEDVRALPGVESASTVLTLPMHWGLRGTLIFNIEGRHTEDGEDPIAGYQIASPDYIRTMRIPLVRGRWITQSDDEDAPRVAVVNEAFAKKYWPRADPIGERISWGDPDAEDVAWFRIVGIVGDTTLDGLDQPATRSESARRLS